MLEEKEYVVTPPEIPGASKTRTPESVERIAIIKMAIEGKKGLTLSQPEVVDFQEARHLAKTAHHPEMLALLKRYSRTLAHHVALFDEHLLPSLETEAYETPLYRHVYPEALWSAASAIKAANLLVNNQESVFAFSLARPPGHHARKEKIGGFCYLNNVALAVEKLSQKQKKVAILDIDVHHGNGTQEIFWDKDILFVSLHGDPNILYPYSGFPEEKGEGAGEERTVNLPFEIGIPPQGYLDLLRKGLVRIDQYAPDILVVSAGFDTHELDPVAQEDTGETGPTKLREQDYGYVGEEIGKLKKPTLLVLEGGYNLDVLGNSVANFMDGLHLALTHQ